MAKIPRVKGAHHCAVKFKSGAKCLNRVEQAGDLCRKHAKTPAKLISGRYSALQYQSIRDRIADIQAFESDASDLMPEIELMRALVVNFADNYEELAAAIIAWNEDPDNHQRPVQVPKLEDISRLVETVGRLVKSHHDIQNRGSISMEDFRRALSAMGSAVALYVKDDVILRQIEDAWGNIALDAKRPLTPKQRKLRASPDILDGEVVSA